MMIHATAITNLTDARYFAAKEVNYLGFHLEDTAQDYLDPGVMNAIPAWVEGPRLTGWFFSWPMEQVIEAAVFYTLHSVVVHIDLIPSSGQTPEIEWHLLAKPDLGIIEKVANLSIAPQSIVLDLRAHPIAHLEKDPALCATIAEICHTLPTILFCADLQADNLAFYQTHFTPLGFCLSGGAEEKVGMKTFDVLEDLFDMLEEQE